VKCFVMEFSRHAFRFAFLSFEESLNGLMADALGEFERECGSSRKGFR
jgi:hypothetical protein